MKNMKALHLLLGLLAAAILNCLLDGTVNLTVTTALCLFILPVAWQMDKESGQRQ